jgi:hypothetical protein
VVLWSVAALGLVVAVLALSSARRTGRKLDALTQSYWELRYDYTRLRSQLARLDPEQADPSTGSGQGAPDAGAGQAPASPAVSFVPLSSMKKKVDGA